MSDWIQCKSEILDYLDGLLPAEKRQDIASLIEQDPEAKAFYSQMKTLKNQLAKLSPIKPSPDFDTVLRTRIRLEKSMRRHGMFGLSDRIPVLLTAATFAIVAFVVVPNFYRNQRSAQPTASQRQDAVKNFASSPAAAGSFSQQAVHFPMDDVIRIPRGGTPLNSTSARQRISRADSARSFTQERPIITVEF